MKKSLIVATLAVLLSVNVLTPMTYATGDLSENGSGMSENGSDNFWDLEWNSDSNSDGDGNGSDDVGNPAWDHGDDSSQQWGDDLTGDDTTWSDNNQRDDQSSTDDAEILPGEWEGDVDPEDPVALPLAQPMPAMAPDPLGNTAPSPVQNVTLVDGQTFNSILETLAGDLSNITAIVKWTEADMQAATITEDISSAWDGSIVAWYDNGTLYYYTSWNVVMNSDSSAMFKNCSNLTDISVLSTWNTTNVTSLYDFFNGCSSLTDVSAVENWNVSSVSDMRSVFYGVWAEIIDLSNWDTSNVTQMNNMFQFCQNLQYIRWTENWNVSNVTNMRHMFSRTPELRELNLAWWNTSNVTNMSYMFWMWSSDPAPKLEKIYVSTMFVVGQIVEDWDNWSTNMFNRRTSLPNYDSSVVNKNYAKINMAWQNGAFTSVDPIVTFNTNGGNEENFAQVVKAWNKIDVSSIIYPTRNNSAFVGWYSNKDLTTEFDFDSEIIQDTTVYAKYGCDDGYRESIDKMSCVPTQASDGTLVQDLHLYFIDESSKVTHYVIMDRNMWASEVFNQDTTNQNTSSFGNYYQWWNNYGFKYDDVIAKTITTSNKQIPYSEWSVYEPSTYSSWVYILHSSNWHVGATVANDNLWWWANDTATSIWAWTRMDRKWPCPDWYYVPSALDWNSVLLKWKDSVADNSDYNQYSMDLLLPIAWDVNRLDIKHDNKTYWLYWTSSSQGSNNWYRMMLRPWDYFRLGNYNKSWWENVRCFKNNFKPTWVASSITVHPNGGQKAVIAVDEDEVMALGEPTKTGFDFLGWYTTSDFQSWSEISTWVSLAGISDLYARWEWTVKFVDYDGAVITTGLYASGTLAADIEKPSDPKRPADAQYTYTFAGWSPALADVTWDATYTATYLSTLNQYTITFVDEDGTVLQAETEYEYWTSAEDILKPANPTKKWYNFKWWSPDIKDVTWDVTYTATYKKRWSNRSGGWKWWGSDPEPTHGSADDERPDEDCHPSADDWTGDIQNPSDDIPENEGGEIFDVHKWAYLNWLTKYANIKDARFDDPLNRAEMAKISSIFDTNFLGRTPDESKEAECSSYPDISKMKGDLHYFVVQSCELSNMWYEYDNVNYIPNFMPYKSVSVAEASIILSRMTWWKKYIIDEWHWYQWHMQAVYDNGLIDDNRDPFRSITRREAFTALYRLDKMLKEKK